MLDCMETPTEYTLQADLPGVNPSDVHVNVENGCIRIEGDRKSFRETESINEYHMERKFGKVERIIRLPWNADQGRANASFSHGVLTVSFPKSSSALPSSHIVPVITR